MKNEKLKNCPICGNEKHCLTINAIDYTVSKEKFEIVECQHCKFVFTNPRPDQESIGKYYESDTYISHTNSKETLFEKVYHLVRNYTLKSKLNIINRYAENNKSILDYGCGTGAFLSICKQNGWKIEGIEPNISARNQTEDSLNQKIFENKDEIETSKKYKVITLWHVLEHVHELNETFEWLKNRLEDNGRLMIAVPNHLSEDANEYKEHWAAYDVPRHLYHFDQNSMGKLTKKFGMKIEKILPMQFDSFYVSMLSSKYKYGKTNLIESFWIGLKSNVKAYLNNKNYSSLIYIISKA